MQSLLDISIVTYSSQVGNGEVMNQAQLLNKLSEVAERIAEHRLHAKVELFCLEDGDIMVAFMHFSSEYPRGCRSVCLFTFHKEHNLNAWHNQLDKVFEGDLLDES